MVGDELAGIEKDTGSLGYARDDTKQFMTEKFGGTRQKKF
jgi:hypothetical protein